MLRSTLDLRAPQGAYGVAIVGGRSFETREQLGGKLGTLEIGQRHRVPK